MEFKEISERINELEAELDELLSSGTFVLQKRIAEIDEEIAELQSNCPHEFEDGICIYCGKEEEE